MSLGTINAKTLNTSTINSGADVIAEPDVENLCLGEFNAAPMNSWEVNGCIFYAVLIPEVVFSLQQLVGTVISETVCSIEQVIEKRIAVGGTAVSFEQNIKNTIAAQDICQFTQMQVNAHSFFTRYGWDAAITINGAEIDKSAISGNIIITKEPNQNTLCTFRLLSTSPLDLIETIDGKTVIINYFDEDGGHRLFTGIIDYPEVDLINKWITIQCSDRREELIKEKILHLLPTIGRYAEQVQGEITSVANEMEYRLETVPQDVDFDAYNNPNINSWYSKATADYTFSASQVYYRQPKITWQSRSAIINDIDLEIKYQYPRLYHYQRPFSWETSAEAAPLISGDHEDGFSFPTVGMINEAINGAGWRHNNSFTYEESLSNYWVTYSMVESTTMRPYIGGPAFGLIRVPMIHHLEDEDQFEVVSANWNGSTRFAQTVEETYTLSVTASQSINQYGSITGFNNYSVQADYDTNTWENYKIFTSAPADAIVSNDSYYVDKDINKNDKINTILTAIDKAKTQILASHRDTKVTFEVPIQPDLELRHTVEIDTSVISCKGKVSKIIHNLDVNEKRGLSTEVEVSLFRSQGSSSTDDTLAPSKPSDTVSIPSSSIALGNRMGYDFDSMPVSVTDTWSGFIGNTLDPLTRYRERFIVDTPSAPPELRDLRSLAATDTYNVAIPNDDLDIQF